MVGGGGLEHESCRGLSVIYNWMYEEWDKINVLSNPDHPIGRGLFMVPLINKIHVYCNWR